MTRIYITDLDGTLLNSEAKVSPFTRRTITELIERGVKFTIASARSIYSIRNVVENLPVSLPAIEMDGAQITDMVSCEHLVINSMPLDVVKRIHGMFAESGFEPIVTCTDGTVDRILFPKPLSEVTQWYVEKLREVEDPRVRTTDDVTEAFGDNVTTLMMIGPQVPMTNLANEIVGEFDSTITIHFDESPHLPGQFWLRVQDSRTSKGKAVEALAKRMGFDVRDAVVFGDALNDISMFKTAAHAVATANALPEAKRVADEIIGSNDEDAVAKWISKDVEG